MLEITYFCYVYVTQSKNLRVWMCACGHGSGSILCLVLCFIARDVMILKASAFFHSFHKHSDGLAAAKRKVMQLHCILASVSICLILDSRLFSVTNSFSFFSRFSVINCSLFCYLFIFVILPLECNFLLKLFNSWWLNVTWKKSQLKHIFQEKCLLFLSQIDLILPDSLLHSE